MGERILGGTEARLFDELEQDLKDGHLDISSYAHRRDVSGGAPNLIDNIIIPVLDILFRVSDSSSRGREEPPRVHGRRARF